MITIIGGGPAGLAAALSAADAGAKVRLIEASARLGGQYWRHLPESGPHPWTGQANLQSDYKEGWELRTQVLDHPNIEVICDAQIWSVVRVDNTVTLHFLESGVDRTVETRALILATGAYDRTLPFPGWDIPGVMTPGGAQALLKGSNVLAGKKIVLAGSGPFLLPVAAGLSQAGGEIVGLYEAHQFRRWIFHARVALANLPKLLQGVRYFRVLFSKRIFLKRGFAVISAHAGSDGVLESVKVARIDSDFHILAGSERVVRCDVVAVGWGFTPDLSIAHSLGLQQEFGADGSAVVSVDEMQATNQSGIFAAGEITGIGGADLSLTEGRIAGRTAADFLKKIDRSVTRAKIATLLHTRNQQRDFARSLAQIYSVKDGWRSWLTEETIVCRCEEVSCGSLKEAIHELGATEVRSAKMFCRVGMGACQGRICSRSIIEIVAAENQLNPTIQDHISSNNRPIFAPITLGQLARGSTPIDGF
jgi:NADPH-dependent 2,4-dienoyl-CoA reductase/sulfur reductase-like enzyme